MAGQLNGTGLIRAAERGHADIVGRLLQTNIDVNHINNLYVRRVVQTEIDINHVNDLGWTALMEAVLFGQGSPTHQDIIRALLDAGADPTIPDSDGTTPAQHAEARGHQQIVDLLTAE